MASVLEIGDRFDLARALSGAARAIAFAAEVGLRSARVRAAPPGPGRAAPPAGAPPARRGGRRAPRGGGAGPRRRGRPRPGAGAARGRDGRPHRAAGGGGHPAPPRRHRARAARTLAAGGAGRAAVAAGRRAPARRRRRVARPHRPVGAAVPRVGRGARPAAPRPRAHLDRRPAPGRGRGASPARLTTRVARPDLLLVGVPAARHRQGPRRRPLGGGRVGHPADRAPAGVRRARRRAARRDGRPPPAAAAHRDAPRPRRPGDDHPRRRHPRRHRRGPQGRGRHRACCWTCSRPSPRRTRWPPGRACGARGSSRCSPSWGGAAGPHWPGSGSAGSPPNPSRRTWWRRSPPVAACRSGSAGATRPRCSSSSRTARACSRPPRGCSPCTRWRCTRPSWRPSAADGEAAGRSRCCGSRCRRASAACPTRPCCGPSWAVCSTARSPSARRWPARSATTRRCCRRGRSPPRPACCGSTTRSPAAVVLELRATDRIGMLHRVAAALEECDAQVRWARVATLGVVGGRLLRPAVPARRTGPDRAAAAGDRVGGARGGGSRVIRVGGRPWLRRRP